MINSGIRLKDGPGIRFLSREAPIVSQIFNKALRDG